MGMGGKGKGVVAWDGGKGKAAPQYAVVKKPWVKQEDDWGKGKACWKGWAEPSWMCKGYYKGGDKGGDKGKGKGKGKFKAAPLSSQYWASKVEAENRRVLGQKVFSGVIASYNLKQGWGFIRPDSPELLPAPARKALEAAKQAMEEAGKECADDYALYFRKPDVNHQEGFKLTSDISCTFNVYLDDKGAGACEVSMA